MDADLKTLYYQKFSFFRKLDWRWRRARRLVEKGRRLSSGEDGDTVTVVKHLRAAARCRTDRDWDFFHQNWRSISAGHQLSAATGPRLWEIQARILAGQSDAEIAERCGLAPETIHWYEALHYNVRDRLSSPDWIASAVFVSGLWADFGTMWMAFGYYGGAEILDVILAVSLQDGLVAREEFHRAKLPTIDGQLAESARLAIQSIMMPAGSLKQFADLHLGVRRAEKMLTYSPVAVVVGEAVQQMMDTAEFPLDNPSQRTPSQHPQGGEHAEPLGCVPKQTGNQPKRGATAA